MHARRQSAKNQQSNKPSALQITTYEMLQNKHKRLLTQFLEPVALLAAVAEFGVLHLSNEVYVRQASSNIDYTQALLERMVTQQKADRESYQNAIGNLESYVMQSRFTLSISLSVLYGLSNVVIKRFKIPQIKDGANLTVAKLNEEIQNLKKQNAQLEYYIQMIKRRSKYIATILALFLFSQFVISRNALNANAITGYIMLVFLTFHLGRIATRNPKIKLDEQLSEIEAALPRDLCECKSEEGINLNSSYIVITASDFKSVPAKIVANFFRKALLNSGFNVVSIKKEVIVISADFKINKAAREKLKKDIEQSVQEYQKLKEFSEQIEEKLAKALSVSTCPFPEKDKSGNLAYKYYVHVPAEFLDVINKEALSSSSLFPSAAVSKYKNCLVISGNTPCDQKSLATLLDEIKDIKAIQKAKKQADLTVSAPTNIASRKTEVELESQTDNLKQRKTLATKKQEPVLTKKEALLKQIAEEKANAQQQSPTQISWTSGFFDAANKNCQVKEIEGGNRIPAETFFSTSFLKKEDLANYPGAFEKIEEKKAHLAPSRMGSEGIIFLDEPKEVKDVNGKTFMAAAKLKMLGVFGNMRGYYELQHAQDGQVLCVLRGFKAKAH